MYEFKKKIGKVLTSKSVGTGPSSYEKRIYRAAVSQSLRNTVIDECCHLLRLCGMGDRYMNMEHWRNDSYCEI